jgi:phage-related protein
MLPVTFYKSAVGNDPVVEWFRDLSKADRKRVGLDLLRVQENWPIGMPVCKSLGKGLWEVRSALLSNRISRVMFFMQDSEICVVHGFVKKTQATTKQDLELALKRMKEMQS